jgi:dissimilatory sulfite reductase (desulfoviridin) alpha/beta subunit
MNNHENTQWYVLGGTIVFIVIVSIIGFIDLREKKRNSDEEYEKRYVRIEKVINQWVKSCKFDIETGRIALYIDKEGLDEFCNIVNRYKELEEEKIHRLNMFLSDVEKAKINGGKVNGVDAMVNMYGDEYAKNFRIKKARFVNATIH